MSTGARISLEVATKLGARTVERMKENCDRVVVAGSVRRQKPEVGDLEILCIPTVIRDLLGNVVSNRFADAVAPLLTDRSVLALNGPKQKKVVVRLPNDVVFNIDIFTATEATWPVQLAIRTGPASFSKALVTPVSKGGRLRDGYHIREGRLRLNGGPEATPEAIELLHEREFLENYAGGWVEPQDRR